MTRNHRIPRVLCGSLGLLLLLAIGSASAGAGDNTQATLDHNELATNGNLVFDVRNNGSEKMLRLLKRAEMLADEADNTDGLPELAIVLHGPDLRLFDQSAYKEHKALVDLAASLDARGVIDFKACQTTARMLGIDNDSLPPFMERVPYGPNEVKRLKAKGFTEL